MMYLNSKVGMIFRPPPSTEHRFSKKSPNFSALTSDNDQPNVGFGDARSLVARATATLAGVQFLHPSPPNTAARKLHKHACWPTLRVFLREHHRRV